MGFCWKSCSSLGEGKKEALKGRHGRPSVRLVPPKARLAAPDVSPGI